MAYTTIKKPSDYFNTVLWTGNGTSQSITGVNFQPDFSWSKQRNVNQDNVLLDLIRGTTKQLYSSDTSAEQTNTTGVISFDSDGFSLGSSGYFNTSSNTYVAWNWLANNTTASNTDGSITSTVSANTTSGFSIVSYTGNGSSSGSNVIGHGLGTTPSMIIIKARAGTNAVNNWYCWHKGLSANNNLNLNTTSAQFTTSTATAGIINTSPTATTFGFDSGTSLLNVNESGTTYIAYCFAEKQGFSKFGSYTGTGGSGFGDFNFIYTGFKPSFFMVKNTTSIDNWNIWDSARSTYNSDFKQIYANSNSAEGSTTGYWDFLSNGIKQRHSGFNTSGNTYIYMAFAEEPLVGDNPATAR